MSKQAANEIFSRLDRELWLITAHIAQKRGGLIATFVSQASLPIDLPRVLVGLARHHYTHELVEKSRGFALHLLGEQHLDWVWRFGLQSGRDVDKLASLRLHEGLSGSPILVDALGWLDCRVEASLETGDRTVYLAEVLDAKGIGDAKVLTVKRMLELAPPERRRVMDVQLERDSAVDAAAIEAWRKGRAAR